MFVSQSVLLHHISCDSLTACAEGESWRWKAVFRVSPWLGELSCYQAQRTASLQMKRLLFNLLTVYIVFWAKATLLIGIAFGLSWAGATMARLHNEAQSPALSAWSRESQTVRALWTVCRRQDKQLMLRWSVYKVIVLESIHERILDSF